MNRVSAKSAWIVLLVALATLPAAHDAAAVRIKDLCDIVGANDNDLFGIGLVVGLAGTGDKNADAVRRQERLLDRLDIDIASVNDLRSDNVAVVMVDAVLPQSAKAGTRVDVRVSSIYDCSSLEGGVLMPTFLRGINDEVYAVAQGPVSIGGFNVQGGGGGSGVRKNHATVGRVPMGCRIEREIPSTITDGERMSISLKRPDFITANAVTMAINDHLKENAATALGAGTINIRIPREMQGDLVSFVASIQEINVRTDMPARVVINERTGTIVVGGQVMIRPCQVAHGNLSIQIATTPVVSQPPPFSPGETVRTEITDLQVTEETAYLMPVWGASAGDVAAALNKLKVTPRDMIAIFQALREAGALEADLEIM